ncbi:MAG TPA: hypothetical protein VMZ04_08735 [Anaerolineae bacterium]|nr:hypothetical protein [Anaerolineae bacterium]
MRIAIPNYNSCVSPVLDTAERLIVVEADNGAVTSQREIILAGAGSRDKAKTIANNADVLVCGAISRTMCTYLDSLGVIVHPWTMGNIEPIIEIVSAGNIPGAEYIMPGCRRGRHGRCRRDQGFHAGESHFTPSGNTTVTERKGRNR